MKYNPTSWLHYFRFLSPPNCDHPDAMMHKVWQHCKFGRWSWRKNQRIWSWIVHDNKSAKGTTVPLFKASLKAHEGKWTIA